MALLCSFRPMANRMISSAPYQLRAKLEVAEMSVNEGDDLEVVNTFYIQDATKRIELYTATSQEKRVWMEAMWQARCDLMERKSSLRLGSISPSEEDLGLKEPAKIKSDSVSKCMECHTAFTMLKRKHHCHACGSVSNLSFLPTQKVAHNCTTLQKLHNITFFCSCWSCRSSVPNVQEPKFPFSMLEGSCPEFARRAKLCWRSGPMGRIRTGVRPRHRWMSLWRKLKACWM